MIDKLLAPVLETAGKVFVQGATTFGKAVIEHFTKHGTKYLIGGGAAAAGGAAYAVGESVGHSKGKKEGTAEQAARDEKKSMICINNMKMIVSVGMKRNKLMRICWMKQKTNYNYGIQTFKKKDCSEVA